MKKSDRERKAYTGRDKYTIDRWIRWLLSFQYQDLKRLSDEDAKHISGRITGFSDVAPRGYGNLSKYSIRQLSLSSEEWDKIPALSKRQIQSIQKKLCDGLNLLMSENADGNPISRTRKWDIHQIRYEGATLLRSPGNGWIGMRPNIKLPGAFWLSVSTLLEKAGRRLQLCPECKTIFLAKTSRKSCCSSQCSRKGRNRRFFDKKSPEEKYEMRRASYVRQVQQTQGEQKIAVEKRGPRKEKEDLNHGKAKRKR